MRLNVLHAVAVVLISLVSVTQGACPGGFSTIYYKYEQKCSEPNMSCSPDNKLGQNCHSDCSIWDFKCATYKATCERCTPTKNPTNSPTRYPTLSPTKRPTGFPSVSPTPRPTPLPSVSPTSGPSVNPTPSPTGRPSATPTTPIPSASPTIPRDKCTDAEIRRWANGDNENFDVDIKLCFLEGVSTTGPEDDVREVVSDYVYGCIYGYDGAGANKRNDPFSEPCAFCWGRYTRCLYDECAQFNCFELRKTNDECVQCSKDFCEEEFDLCTGGMTIPKVPDGTISEDFILMIAIGGGAFVFLLISGVTIVTLVKRRRRMAELKVLAAQISSNKKDSDSDIGSDNPLYEDDDGPANTEPATIFDVNKYGVEDDFETGMITASSPFAAQYEDELTVTTGQRLQLVKAVDDDWVIVRDPATKKQGLVPRTHFS